MSNETTRTDRFNVQALLMNSRIKKWGLYIGIYGFAFLYVVPYLWMVSTSVTPISQIFSSNPYWIPPEPTYDWYLLILFDSPVIQWTINTIMLAVGATIAVVISDSMAAYSLSRLDWPGKRFVIMIIIVSFMVPGAVNIIPVYEIVSNFGLVNSLWGIILPWTAGVFGVFMLMQFFKDIPDEVEEAAVLDGFSTLHIFLRIAVPLQFPAIAALALFTFIGTWNSFLWPLIILQDQAMYTLPIGLVTLEGQQVEQPGLIMSGALIASLPLIILFVALQDYLFKAVALSGSVK